MIGLSFGAGIPSFTDYLDIANNHRRYSNGQTESLEDDESDSHPSADDIRVKLVLDSPECSITPRGNSDESDATRDGMEAASDDVNEEVHAPLPPRSAYIHAGVYSTSI